MPEPQPPRTPQRQFGTNITNVVQQRPQQQQQQQSGEEKLSPMRRAPSYEQKRRLLQLYDARPKGEKRKFLVFYKLDRPTMSEWRQELTRRDALPKSKQPSSPAYNDDVRMAVDARPRWALR
jgi:hypothetical protein